VVGTRQLAEIGRLSPLQWRNQTAQTKLSQSYAFVPTAKATQLNLCLSLQKDPGSSHLRPAATAGRESRVCALSVMGGAGHCANHVVAAMTLSLA